MKTESDRTGAIRDMSESLEYLSRAAELRHVDYTSAIDLRNGAVVKLRMFGVSMYAIAKIVRVSETMIAKIIRADAEACELAAYSAPDRAYAS
jgi:hypothetical protein